MKGLVLHLLGKIKAELPETYLTVATGGISEAITFITNHFDHVYKNLTIDGILKMGSGTPSLQTMIFKPLFEL